MEVSFIIGIAVLIFLLILIISCIKIVPQANIFVIERFGAFYKAWNTGIHFLVPFMDRVAKKVSIKEQVVDFKPQAVITKDNVTMQIDTVVFFQITDPKLFTYGVENPIMAIENLSSNHQRHSVYLWGRASDCSHRKLNLNHTAKHHWRTGIGCHFDLS